MGNKCLKPNKQLDFDLRENEKLKKEYYLNMPSQNQNE